MSKLNEELSEREIEILRLLATGASNKEIAARLTISANTVKVHVRNIFNKIEVNTRTEAAMYAVKTGLVAEQQASVAAEAETEVESEPAGAAVFETPSPAPAPAARSRLRLVLGGVGALVVVLLGLYYVLSTRQAALQPVSPNDQARWKDLAPMPTARYGLAAAAYEGWVLAIAGFDGQRPTNVVERYDAEGDSWTALTSKPTAVYEVSAVTLGGQIFVPGGRISEAAVTDVLEIYDPRQDAWRQGARLPQALSGYAAVAFEGDLYLFGGWDGNDYVDSVYRYSPSDDAWERLGKMPSARAYAGAAIAGQKIFVVGGYDDRPLADNLVYQPSLEGGAEAWRKAQPLPAGRYGMGVAGIAEIVEVAGGLQSGSGDIQSLSFFPLNNAWQTFGALDETPLMPGIAALGNNLHIVGGQVGTTPIARHRIYQAIYSVSFPIIR